MHRWFKITPVDTLLFRDGMSMEKGSTNYIKSRKMPFPSVVYGAVCTALMQEGYLTDAKKAIRDRADVSELDRILSMKVKLTSLMVLYKGQVLIPAPFDLFRETGGGLQCGYYGVDGLYPPDGDGKLVHADGSFISFADFVYRYRKDYIKGLHLTEAEDIWKVYHKAGLEKEWGSNKVKMSHLYQAEMVEFSDMDSAYIICLETEELPDRFSTLLRLGGEARTAFMEPFEDFGFSEHLKAYKEDCISGEEIRVIFSQPAFLESLDLIGDCNIEVEAAVSGRLLRAGGYDMAGNGARQMKKALPAGSILKLRSEFFTGKTVEEVEAKLCECFSVSIPEFFRGYGQFLIK